MRRRLLIVLAVVAVATSVGVLALAANDPYRSLQWNVDRVEAPFAWELSRGAGIVVAVVDTGVDLQHPDLVDRFVRRADGSVVGRDYIDDDDDPDDENGHGTLVAGVVAATADNGEGVVGIAPDARIMPIRVLDEQGAGDGADVDRAIRWAVDNGAHVVNLSLESVAGGGRGPAIPAPTLAVRYAWLNGVIVVAASGNDASRSDDYPDDSPVVLVGATTRDDRRAEFSDAGRTDALMAPGVDITSTWWCTPQTSASCEQEHTYGEANGTSFAAPHVAGAAAVLRALGFSPQETVQRLRDTARDIGPEGPDDQTGHGLIDIAAAAGARNPPSSPSSPAPSASPSASPSPSPSPTVTAPPTPSPSASPSPVEPSPTEPTAPPTTLEPSPADTPSAEPSRSASPSAGPSPSATSVPVASADRDTGSGGPERAAATALLGLAIAGHVAAMRVRP